MLEMWLAALTENVGNASENNQGEGADHDHDDALAELYREDADPNPRRFQVRRLNPQDRGYAV